LHGHTDPVTSVAYSPDGTHIVSGSWDNTIRVWNATTGQCVAGPFQEHTSSVPSVAYSPDGTHIVSGSDPCSIRVWKVNFFPLVIYVRKIAGFNLLMTLALAGWLLGTEILSIFLSSV